MARKSAASKGYRKQNARKPFITKKELIIICVIAAVVIAGFVILLNYDDGALKIADGKVVTEGDNWLITNGAAAQNGTRFFKVGEAGDIEGFTRASQIGMYGENTPEYVYTPDGADGPSESIVIGTYPAKAERLAEYYAEQLEKEKDLNIEISDIRTDKADGVDYSYYIYTSEAGDESEADESGNRCARVVRAYMDTIKDGSVIISVTSPAPTLEACMSEEELLAALKNALAAVSLETK